MKSFWLIHRVRVVINLSTTWEGQSGWLRIKEACDWSRLSKPKPDDLMNRGLRRSVALKEADPRKGTRLIHHATLRTFLESRTVGGSLCVSVSLHQPSTLHPQPLLSARP